MKYAVVSMLVDVANDNYELGDVHIVDSLSIAQFDMNERFQSLIDEIGCEITEKFEYDTRKEARFNDGLIEVKIQPVKL